MDFNEYKTKIDNIKNYASDNNIPVEQVEAILEECLCLLDTKVSSRLIKALRVVKLLGIFLLVIVSSVFILYNHPQTHNVLLRNLQNFIYPGLRVFRKIAVPVISAYPSLTGWYDEWCLLENPYFQVNEMDCWPCRNVNSVKNLTGYNTVSDSGIPFTRLEKYDKFDINELLKLYIEYQDEANVQLDSLSSREKKSYNFNRGKIKFDYEAIFQKKSHIVWRTNRMDISRKLRKLFPKLPGVPDWWSPSMEKFIFIDKPESSLYALPNPECANVIIQCISGERMIELLPSPECTKKCEKLNILLSASQSLWYNWWYWRPVVLGFSNTTDLTITYLTSYC